MSSTILHIPATVSEGISDQPLALLERIHSESILEKGAVQKDELNDHLLFMFHPYLLWLFLPLLIIPKELLN